MADQVDEVKSKIDIVSLISEYIPLKKAGRNYKAPCPFHAEKTPSFMVSPELQMYKCFGCGEAGDAFAFLQKYEGMEFREALKFLADRVGVTLTSFRPGEETEKERLFSLNALALKFYHYILLNHPKAKGVLNYLVEDRGLKPETINTFQLGYSPDVPDAISRFLVGKKQYRQGELERAGITVSNARGAVDRFRGRIIFPLFDHRGNVVGFAGRVLPTDPRAKEIAKYINSPETAVYHKSRVLYGLNLTKEEIKKEKKAVIVEGELDLISSWQAGVKNVVAIKGSAITADQVKLISRFVSEVTLALDADFAGSEAARRGVAEAQKEGLKVLVARLGEFKDPDDAARGNPAFLKKAVEGAVDVWDFILESIFEKGDVLGGEGKAALSRELVPVLAAIPDKIVQAHYLALVAKRLGVPEEAVKGQVESPATEKGKVVGNTTALSEKVAGEKKNRRQLLEERLLTLAFQSEPKFILRPKVTKLVTTPLASRILSEYEAFPSKETFSPSAFAALLPGELVQGFAALTLADTEGLTEDPELLKREINLVIHDLEVADVRHRLEELGVKIRQFEEGKELSKLKDSQEKFGELSQKLSELESAESSFFVSES